MLSGTMVNLFLTISSTPMLTVLGAVPEAFRALAREQIAKYNTTSIRYGQVVSVEQVEDYFRTTDSDGQTFTSRKVIMATGMKDLLPDTPGLQDAWGNGIFWCPWCDGFEHRDQPFGVIGNLTDIMGSVLEMMTLNTDIKVFVNGTHTPAQEAALEEKYPDWEAQLVAYNVQIDNRTITSIERLQDGGEVQDAEQHKEFDIFRVHFAEGEPVVRNAFLTNFPAVQRSELPREMGLTIVGSDKVKVDQSSMRTNVKGVFAIGDMNNDNSTNVPHAMYSGKRAAVFVHGELLLTTPFHIAMLTRHSRTRERRVPRVDREARDSSLDERPRGPGSAHDWR